MALRLSYVETEFSLQSHFSAPMYIARGGEEDFRTAFRSFFNCLFDDDTSSLILIIYSVIVILHNIKQNVIVVMIMIYKIKTICS